MSEKRRKPWRRRLLIAGIVVGGLWWWVDRQLEPQRLSRTVLDQLEQQQGLELEFSGEPEYALRPEPRLLLPELVVTQPGQQQPILRAKKVQISLPWSTILDGEALVITRVELDSPVLDVSALSAWQATRPATPLKFPTLTHGLVVSNGAVRGEGWRVSDLLLDMAALDPAQPAALQFDARIEYADVHLDANATVRASKGDVAGDAELEAKAILRQGERTGPLTVQAKGAFDLAAASPFWAIDELALTLDGGWPTAQAAGSARLGEPLQAQLQGELAHWPADWPVLPEPLQSSEAPVLFVLAYAGAADLSAPLRLRVQRDDASVDGSFVYASMRDWSSRPDRSLLPPLQAEVNAATLEVEGATLEGVHIEILPDEPATTPADAEQPTP